MTSRRVRLALVAFVAGCCFVGGVSSVTVVPIGAQVRPVYSQGIAGVLQAIERLQTTASALHVAAHPDDEDTAFMARTARGDHARVAYLSLNRGEGGQNVIGPELFEALGVIRTEELLQARALDGGDQFFTRTFDFGFSKRLEEAAEKWGEREVLADMVRTIRQYRPLVIYAGFSGTPADGHGQHQLAGKLTPEAWRAAADAQAFPEQIAEGLRPWQARKLYVRVGFRPDPKNPPSARIPTGIFDPLLGRTYFEIAMEGRSQHKSQEMGVPELRGPQFSGLRLRESLVATGPEETSVFQGIDTSLRGLAALAGLPAGSLARELDVIAGRVERVLGSFDVRDPARAVPDLALGLRDLRAARQALPTLSAPADAKAEAEFLLEIKERQFEQALALASGVVLDPLADTETVAAGETFGVTVRLFVPDPALVSLSPPALHGPEGWTIVPGEVPAAPSESPMARFFRETPDVSRGFVVTVPAGTAPTQPYWLTKPRQGGLFAWPESAPKGQPFAPPLLQAEVKAQIGDVPLTLRAPVQYRLIDQIRGELRRNVAVVPAVSVALDSELYIVPTRTLGSPRRIAVRLGSQSKTAVEGTVRLAVPDGWKVEPAEIPFALSNKGQRTAVVFGVTPPPGIAAGRYEIGAEATVGTARFDLAMRTVAYPHIQTHRLYARAAASVRVFDLEIAPVTVGYVMGSGDQVPEAIRRMGREVTLLDGDQLAAGDLAAFDVIVVGIRASEARPDFVASNGRLLDYVRGGGTLIVQYQQPDFAARQLGPYPGEIGSRVTDETAPVKVLAPDHPVFSVPNRVSDADWSEWVQERNLYAYQTFDERYVPLLETADPGEPPQRGGQLYAELGRGRYVYTAYAWFRQLPAGVPGAYRMFANLLSLGDPARRQRPAAHEP